MPQVARPNRSLYNSTKLRENCCANCKKPFVGVNEQLKMTHLISVPQGSDESPQISVVDSFSAIFDGYLKLHKISLNRGMHMYLCIQCASTISSLYRIYKKFMEATAAKSVLKDIIQDSPFWETGNDKPDYVAGTHSNYIHMEIDTPNQDFQAEGEWQADTDGEEVFSSEVKLDMLKSDIVTSIYCPAQTLFSANTNSNFQNQNTPLRASSFARAPPNVQLDKSLTYRQMLELKKSGITSTCTYIPDNFLAPREEPQQIKDLKRGSRVCPFCDWTFRSMTELHDHLLNVAKIETYLCPYPNCGQTFAWDCFYAKHLASVHSELLNKRGCEKCPLTFNTQYELLEHEAKHNEEDVFVTDMDNPPKNLRKQQKVKHGGQIYYPCYHSVCGKLFLDRLYLKRHIENCHEAPPVFSCDRCPWVFPKHDLLAEHSVCHTGELAFSCEHCGDKFNNRKSMENHVFHFHRKRQAVVAEVDKNGKKKRKKKKKSEPFPSSTPKKHKCDECEKAFAKRSNLIQHIRMDHQGLEPLECKICSQRFASDEARQQHEDTYTHKEYSCPDCSKVFYKQARLDAHSDSHIPVLRDKVKPATHICELCGKLFKLPQTLARHLKTHGYVDPISTIE